MGSLDKRYNAPSSSGGGGSRVFDLSEYEGVKFWKQKEGSNKINIIPYKVSSKNHPLVAKGILEKGDMDYTLELWVHTFVGPGNASVVCLKRNYNKPCPICELSDKLKAEKKEKESKALWAKRRMYYNVQDVLNPDDGIQLFETNHKNFEKPLMSLAKDTDDGSPFIDFADIKEGKTLKFMGEKEQFEGKDFIQFANLKFIARPEPVTDLASEALPLDALLVVRPYEEIEAILYGDVADDEDDEPVKAKKRARDDDEDDEPPVTAKKKASPVEDDEDDEPPAKRKAKDDDDEPPAKKADENECPHGMKWGVDNDSNPKFCDKCDKYKACLRAQMAM